jgi:hypothetical protein
MLHRAAKLAKREFDYELSAELTTAAVAVANTRDGRCSMETLSWWWGFQSFPEIESGS